MCAFARAYRERRIILLTNVDTHIGQRNTVNLTCKLPPAVLVYAQRMSWIPNEEARDDTDTGVALKLDGVDGQKEVA